MQIEQVVHQRIEAKYQHEKNNAEFPDEVIKPNVRFSGKNYEVKGPKALAATVVGYIRMMCFMILFAGDMIFNSLGGVHTFPGFVKNTYEWIKENKFQFGLMVFFISSMIQ